MKARSKSSERSDAEDSFRKDGRELKWHVQDGNSREGLSKERKAQKRQSFEIMFQPSRDFLDYLVLNNQKALEDLKRTVPAAEFCIKELDVGDNHPSRVIKIFDEDEERKWGLAVNILNLNHQQQEESGARTGKDFIAVLIIPGGKILSLDSIRLLSAHL